MSLNMSRKYIWHTIWTNLHDFTVCGICLMYPNREFHHAIILATDKPNSSCDFECRFSLCCLMNMLLWLQLDWCLCIQIKMQAASMKPKGNGRLPSWFLYHAIFPRQILQLCYIDLPKLTVQCLNVSPFWITKNWCFLVSPSLETDPSVKNHSLTVWKRPRWALCRCGCVGVVNGGFCVALMICNWAVTTLLNCFIWGDYTI